MTNHPVLSLEEERQVAASERIFAAVHAYLTEMEETKEGGDEIEVRQFEAMKTALAVAEGAKDLRDEAPFGIIDPDYARIYTKARCIAWAEGYALLMHGSFTRDLDLLAVPWAEQACEPDHLARRIAAATDLKFASEAYGEKPHGRLAWTMLFPAFGDPRFVDLSVMPRARDQHASREDGASRLRPKAASPVAVGEAPASTDQVPSPTPARQEEGSRGDGSILECENCGSREDLKSLQSRSFISCCPERKMSPVAAPTPDANSGGEAPGRNDQTAQFIAESDALEAEEAIERAYRNAYDAFNQPERTGLRHRMAMSAAIAVARTRFSAAPHPSQEKGEADA